MPCILWSPFLLFKYVNGLHNDMCMPLCRVEDYWQGYKLFCYAYYSHSIQHESEFRLSKLGLSHCPCPLFFFDIFVICNVMSPYVSTVRNFERPLKQLWGTGRLVWQRHVLGPYPSRNTIRTTCMQLLPLVEMYCKWELQEDCSNLRALMVRFDSERQLESHELGRSLLAMLRDDDVCFDTLEHHDPHPTVSNPFQIVRERLAAAALAMQGLRYEVNILLALCATTVLACWPHFSLQFASTLLF